MATEGPTTIIRRSATNDATGVLENVDAGAAWGALHDAASGDGENTGSNYTRNCGIEADATTDQWEEFNRFGICIPNDNIGSGDSIQAASILVTNRGGTSTANTFTSSPKVRLVAFTPADYSNIGNGDFDQFGSVALSDYEPEIGAIDAMGAVTHLVFPLNDAGLDYIRDHLSDADYGFGLITDWDADDDDTHWENGATAYCSFYQAAVYPPSIFIQYSSSSPYPPDVSSVDTTGDGHYSSLAAWESGEQADLTSSNVIARAECEGGADAGGEVSVTGWTTDMLRFVDICGVDNDSLTGAWDTGIYRGPRILLYDQYTKLHDIQIESSGTDCGGSVGDDSVFVYRVHMKSTNATSQGWVMDSSRSSIDNCMIWLSGAASGYGTLQSEVRSSVTNITIVGANNSGASYTFDTAFLLGTGIQANNLSGGNAGSTNEFYAFQSSGGYNLSEDTSAPNPNAQRSATNDFEGAGTGDFRITISSDAYENGASPQLMCIRPQIPSYLYDIAYQNRFGGGIFDIGAYALSLYSPVRATQLGRQILHNVDPAFRVTQLGRQILHNVDPAFRVTQLGRQIVYTPPPAFVTYTVTAGLDAAVQSALTKAISLSAAVSAEYSKTVSLDAAILATLGKTLSLDASILSALQKTLGLDGAIRLLSNIKTLSLDGAVQSTLTKALSLDAALAVQFSKTLSLSAAIEKLSLTEQLSLDAAVTALGLTSTTSLDAAVIRLGLTKGLALDVALAIVGTAEASLDAAVKATLTDTVSLDANLAYGVIIKALDAAVQKNLSKSVLLDAAVLSVLTEVLSLDAAVVRVDKRRVHFDAAVKLFSIVETLSLDSAVQSNLIEVVSLDGAVVAALTLGVSLDAFVYPPLGVHEYLLQETGEYLLQEDDFRIELEHFDTELLRVDLDAAVQAVLTATVSLDAYVLLQFLKTVSLDAAILKTYGDQVSFDAYLGTVPTKAVSLDAAVRSTLTDTVSFDARLDYARVMGLDALIGATVLKTFNFDALLSYGVAMGFDALIEAKFETVDGDRHRLEGEKAAGGTYGEKTQTEITYPRGLTED